MPKQGHEPIRTCVACRQEAGKRHLVRLYRDAEGLIEVDAGGRAPGRGAYLHSDPACAQLARRRRMLQRALKGELTAAAAAWLAELEATPSGTGPRGPAGAGT
jgi:predicted RNA-binding protein YlxR (DUF448 family)